MRILLLHILSLSPVSLVATMMHLSGFDPRGPHGGVPLQHVPRQDAVTGGVLYVDVDILTAHGNHGIEIDLQRLGNAFLDAELLGFRTSIPATELRKCEEGGEKYEEDSGVATGGGAASIGGFGFR